MNTLVYEILPKLTAPLLWCVCSLLVHGLVLIGIMAWSHSRPDVAPELQLQTLTLFLAQEEATVETISPAVPEVVPPEEAPEPEPPVKQEVEPLPEQEPEPVVKPEIVTQSEAPITLPELPQEKPPQEPVVTPPPPLKTPEPPTPRIEKPVKPTPRPTPQPASPPSTPSKGEVARIIAPRPEVNIQQLKKVYPPEARKRHQQGVVTLRIRVDARGSVEGIAIEKSSGFPILDNAARKMLRKVKFTPAQCDGRAVSGELLQAIEYRLD